MPFYHPKVTQTIFVYCIFLNNASHSHNIPHAKFLKPKISNKSLSQSYVNYIFLCKILTITFNPLSTTGLLTQYLIGLYHEMFICLANYEKPLKVRHHKPDHDTIFSYILSNWLNKLWSIHFDQSAGSSHGVYVRGSGVTSIETCTPSMIITFPKVTGTLAIHVIIVHKLLMQTWNRLKFSE